MGYVALIDDFVSSGRLPQSLAENIGMFCTSYEEALKSSGRATSENLQRLETFITLVAEEIEHPFAFEAYHERIISPFDYYQFGMEIIRPLISFENSSVVNLPIAKGMEAQIKRKENVILFANHQTEPDPQIINLLLEKECPDFAKEIIFVAGHRVTSDPLAIPFSKGCNLLCIFSKKHIENPPEHKEQKQLHNQKTMKRMQALLEEGGKCIFVAPSGGRDRVNADGIVEVAPFDPQSVEMFRLIALQANQRTHFYPLTLSSYALLPPPSRLKKSLGEKREAKCTPVHLCFRDEIDMDNFPGCDPKDKRKNRELRANYIFNLVKEDYQQFI